MRFIAFLISLIILPSAGMKAYALLDYTADDARRSLEMLDDTLARRNVFIERRQASIDNLANLLRQENIDTAGIMMMIAERYTSFNNDSALHYLEKGLQYADGIDKIPFHLKQSTLLPLTGSFELARNTYEQYSPDSIPAEIMPLYLESGRQMYSYMSTFSPVGSVQKERYNQKALELQNKLIDILPKDSQEYRYHLGEYYFLTGQKGKARALLEDIFESEPIHSNLRARAAHHLSSLAKDEGDDDAYIYYIASAALADITAATREVAALQELGNYLFTKNDVERSYQYLTLALASAVECGASLRMIESSRTLPVIERAKRAQIESKERTIYIIGGILILILIGLAALLMILRREMNRMRDLQEHLRAANKAKEVYISQFLTLCSIYMDKLNQFCKIANRKITAGKVDDLYKLTKNGKFIEEQSKEFYDVFDTAFLHMYPDFPRKVNELLRPDEQIELKEGELLNTDLRILAFLRLGIEETTRIAQVLNYSVNTIYAYRNRTKARAINRETFEEDVMKISSSE